MDPDLTRWPSVEEAAAILQTSRRSIERKFERGEIEIRKRTRPGKKPENVCNPADVEKLKPAAYVIQNYQEDEAPAPRNAPPRGSTLDDFALRLWEAIERARPAALEGKTTIAPLLTLSELSLKLWLTVEEAAALSGYAESKLRAAIAAGTVKATRGGPRRSWIIQRAALEEFAR